MCAHCSLQELQLILVALVAGEYSWHDLYTQCVITNYLLAVQTDLPYESDFCDPPSAADDVTGGSQRPPPPRYGLQRQLSHDVLRLLDRYLTAGEQQSMPPPAPLDYGTSL